MSSPRVIALCLTLPLASCATGVLHSVQQKAALPSKEVARSPQTLVGRKVASSKYDVYRFQGWLVPKDSPRYFDLYLPKDREHGTAKIKEVKSAVSESVGNRSITASIDMRYTSGMLLSDPVYRKQTNLAIGESIAAKGRCVSVSLREGEKIHRWDAPLDLKWTQRDKAAHRVLNGLYVATVPFDIVAKAAELSLESDVPDPFRQ